MDRLTGDQSPNYEAIAESDDDELEPDHMLTEGARRAAFLEGAVWFGYRTVRSSSHAFHPSMQCS